MPKQALKPDSRTLVDRVIDRIKNNRIAATVIMASIGIGAVANLTDSTKKISESLSSFSTTTIDGEWKSDQAEFYLSGPEYMRINIMEAAAGQILGTVQLSGNSQLVSRTFDLLETKRDGKKLTLSFDSGARHYSGADDKSTPLKETIVGEVVGDEMHFVYLREGAGGVSSIARRISQASQLVIGRTAITYKRIEYPDHQTACTQLLKELAPPQAYKQSEPPDTDGNIRCVGMASDGSSGFDQYENDVQQVLICPPNSRKTIPLNQPPDPLKQCECDGWALASGGQCATSLNR